MMRSFRSPSRNQREVQCAPHHPGDQAGEIDPQNIGNPRQRPIAATFPSSWKTNGFLSRPWIAARMRIDGQHRIDSPRNDFRSGSTTAVISSERASCPMAKATFAAPPNRKVRRVNLAFTSGIDTRS
ncbi:MAG: hypothetical protein DME65_04875 [Verrucomicrobia bacterium]|nr:MAG: hypothetical protein DME65_04875 [Verrucomicrobiota bacterium]